MCPFRSDLTIVLSAGLEAPAQARHLVATRTCRRHASDSRHASLLVVSELVTNAVLHGRPPICLSLRCVGETALEISVGDGSKTPPELMAPPPGALGGRGMALVDLLSTDWGTIPTSGGKMVWSRIDAR